MRTVIIYSAISRKKRSYLQAPCSLDMSKSSPQITLDKTPAPASLLPRHSSFAGHQTFAVRAGWLKKGLDAIAHDPQFFARDEALVVLGVGKNMVSAIRHWLLATDLARATGRDIAATPLGLALFDDDGFDPYLEDPATLWLLHWHLCGPGSACFSWVYAFNLLREWEWTREQLMENLQTAAARNGKTPAPATLARDVGVLLQTYAQSERGGQNSEDGLDCPLRELGLIVPTFESQFRFAVGPKSSLPPAIFAYALLKFWNWKAPHGATLSAREIAGAPGSPGQIFKLDEDSTLAYLDALADVTRGALRFEDTPLVRQVVRERTALRWDEMLTAHYERMKAKG